MKISKLRERGKAYKVLGQAAVFMAQGNSVAASSAAAICYTDTDDRYDVMRTRYNYVKGVDVKKWVKTKGRSGLTWERAVSEYNSLNLDAGI